MKTPEEIAALCLQRIREREPEVRAWATVADRVVGGSGRLPVPFGSKDIFESRDFPTNYGSALFRNLSGTQDAGLIAYLRESGAVLLGKTHTTAFASFDPAPTRNPRLAGHTPGGSSAGSAAAVAAGMVPFAIGSQTLGSMLRPASYCGVCGFKPTFGRLPAQGMMAFAPSLDTPGLFTETAADMACLWQRGFGGRAVEVPRRAAVWGGAKERRTTKNDAGTDLRRQSHWEGIEVEEIDPPAGWGQLLEAAITINEYEGARSLAARYAEFGESIGARLAELVRRGLQISEGKYGAALAHVAEMRDLVARLFEEYPVILTPAATGPAPAGYESTGDPRMNAPWTALGVPAISVPLPVEGAPRGMQITAARGHDDELVAFAARVEGLTP